MDNEGLPDMLVEAETSELKDAETLPDILVGAKSESLSLFYKTNNNSFGIKYKWI